MVRACGICKKYWDGITYRTFHTFPFKDVALRKKWIEALEIDESRIKKCFYVCSDHFDKSCYSTTAFTNRSLMKGSVPSIKIAPENSEQIQRQQMEDNLVETLPEPQEDSTEEEEVIKPNPRIFRRVPQSREREIQTQIQERYQVCARVPKGASVAEKVIKPKKIFVHSNNAISSDKVREDNSTEESSAVDGGKMQTVLLYRVNHFTRIDYKQIPKPNPSIFKTNPTVNGPVADERQIQTLIQERYQECTNPLSVGDFPTPEIVVEPKITIGRNRERITFERSESETKGGKSIILITSANKRGVRTGEEKKPIFVSDEGKKTDTQDQVNDETKSTEPKVGPAIEDLSGYNTPLAENKLVNEEALTLVEISKTITSDEGEKSNSESPQKINEIEAKKINSSDQMEVDKKTKEVELDRQNLKPMRKRHKEDIDFLEDSPSPEKIARSEETSDENKKLNLSDEGEKSNSECAPSSGDTEEDSSKKILLYRVNHFTCINYQQIQTPIPPKELMLKQAQKKDIPKQHPSGIALRSLTNQAEKNCPDPKSKTALSSSSVLRTLRKTNNRPIRKLNDFQELSTKNCQKKPLSSSCPENNDHEPNFKDSANKTPITKIIIDRNRGKNSGSTLASSDTESEISHNVDEMGVNSPSAQDKLDRWLHEEVLFTKEPQPPDLTLSSSSKEKDEDTSLTSNQKMINKPDKPSRQHFVSDDAYKAFMKYASIQQKTMKGIGKNISKKLKRRHNKIQRLESGIEQLKKKNKESIAEDFEGLPQLLKEILDRLKNNKPTEAFSPFMQDFAKTIHDMSPSAYEIIRNEFIYCLPHPHTIANHKDTKKKDPKEDIQLLEL